MTTLFRSQVVFEGWSGGPGYATFYSLDITTFQPALITLWSVLAAKMPSGISVTVKESGDKIEDTTGELVGAWFTGTPEAPIGAGDTSAYAAPAGSLINWTTGTILDGRRIKGHTFVVPLCGDQFTVAGGISGAWAAVMAAAAAAFQTSQSASLVIWHRPRKARLGPVPPAAPARLGGNALVTGSSVPLKAAVLKSRRDN